MNAQSNGAPASLPDYVPVIVIGAGPTGMTAATMLAQQRGRGDASRAGADDDHRHEVRQGRRGAVGVCVHA